MSRPKKTRSPFKAVPNLRTHFVLEDSLWEDEDDDCNLVSFSSRTFLPSWSLSASPYNCGITKYNCYQHNGIGKIGQKNTQQMQGELHFWRHPSVHTTAFGVPALCEHVRGEVGRNPDLLGSV